MWVVKEQSLRLPKATQMWKNWEYNKCSLSQLGWGQHSRPLNYAAAPEPCRVWKKSCYIHKTWHYKCRCRSLADPGSYSEPKAVSYLGRREAHITYTFSFLDMWKYGEEYIEVCVIRNTWGRNNSQKYYLYPATNWLKGRWLCKQLSRDCVLDCAATLKSLNRTEAQVITGQIYPELCLKSPPC